MNPRPFLCCLILFSVFSLSPPPIAYARQTTSSPGGAFDKEDGFVIPFQYDPIVEPQIVVRVSIDGKPPLLFSLDTGATAPLIVFTGAAKVPGLRPGAQTDEASAFGQVLSLPVAPVKTARLTGTDKKSITFTVHQAEIADDALFRQANPLTPRMAGIIGLGILVPNLSGVRFDFEAKTMTLFTKTNLAYGIKNATLLTMTRGAAPALYSVGIVYGSGRIVELAVDTGSQVTQLPLSAVPFLDPMAETRDFFATAAAVYLTSKILLRNLNLGAYPVPNVVVTVFPDSPSYSLGLNVLSRFLITLDFRNGQMIVQQPAHPISSEAILGYVGCGVYKRNNDYFITKLAKSLPAEAVGIHVGDKILSVDGHLLHGLSDLRAAILILGTAGTRAKVLLERSNGKRFTVSLLRSSVFDRDETATTGLILKRPTGAPITLLAVSKGSPGDKAGLRGGDRITALDGENTAKMSADDLIEALPGDSLSLTLLHLGDKATRRVHLAAVPH